MAQARLLLRVQPGARRTEIVGFQGQRLRIRVVAPPERGRANEAAIELLAQALGVPKSRVRLAKGAASRDKLLVIDGMDEGAVRQRLGAVHQ